MIRIKSEENFVRCSVYKKGAKIEKLKSIESENLLGEINWIRKSREIFTFEVLNVFITFGN